MKKVAKELKKYKYTTIVVVLFLIMIGLAYFCYTMFFGAIGVPQYGNRLDGREEVMPSKDSLDNACNELQKQYQDITEITAKVNGNIIDYIIKVNKDTSTKTAKEMIKNVTKIYTKDQISYFDFQVFVDCEEEKSGFPIIGYKSKKATDFSFVENKD